MRYDSSIWYAEYLELGRMLKQPFPLPSLLPVWMELMQFASLPSGSRSCEQGLHEITLYTFLPLQKMM